jgi:hypothetical protein
MHLKADSFKGGKVKHRQWNKITLTFSWSITSLLQHASIIFNHLTNVFLVNACLERNFNIFVITFSCKRSVNLWQGARKHRYELFLGASAKLREAIFRFVVYVRLSVRPSARMEQFCFHRTAFLKILHLIVLPKYVEKIQVSLKSKKNNSSLHEGR